jgi:hypothetical protein
MAVALDIMPTQRIEQAMPHAQPMPHTQPMPRMRPTAPVTVGIKEDTLIIAEAAIGCSHRSSRARPRRWCQPIPAVIVIPVS